MIFIFLVEESAICYFLFKFSLLKKVISLFLFFAISLPFLVTYSYLTYEKKQLKRSIKHAIIAKTDLSELTKLSFSKENVNSQLNWEHSKEFEYKGEMYDVVETKESQDSITYWCWWDHKETVLNKKLTKLFCGVYDQQEKPNSTKNQFLQFAKKLIHPQTKVLKIEDVAYSQKVSLFHYQEKELTHFKEIPNPPPEITFEILG